MNTTTLTPLWRANLTHMLGAGPDVPKGKRGYRNHFCSVVLDSDKDYQSMLEMREAGLVRAGGLINGGTCQFFYATVEGCQAIGLSKAAIKQAMEN